MTDSPHRFPPGGREQSPPVHPIHADPAYANDAPYGVPYQPATGPAPTRQLPAQPQCDNAYDPSATRAHGVSTNFPTNQVPPHRPGGPAHRWLWLLAGVSVLVVIGLVVALVIVSSEQQTVVAPAPTLEPSATTPPTTTRRSTPARTPSPALPVPPPSQTTPTVPGETETVDYVVGGDGRAMSITYVDSGGVLQTEFNVPLPWSRKVELAEPADSSASVTIINFGRQLTCSVTVSGRVLDRHTGSGLTICGARG